MCKYSTIYLTSHRVSLTLIENPTPIGKVFVDKFDKDDFISFAPLGVQDKVKSPEEFCLEDWFLCCIYRKVNDGTTTMEWLDDLILVITGEDEPTVSAKLLNRGSKKELYIGSGIVCLINNKDFMFRV